MCHAGPMAQIVCPLVSAEDRARLEAIVADRNRAQKHVARARIILGSADRLNVAAVARRAGIGRPAVWRWQRRFAEAGVDGLLRDATRKPGKAPLGDRTVRSGGDADLCRAARRSDPLDRPGDGQDERRLPALGAADLGGARPAAAPHPHLQALDRSRVRRQARGHRRPVRRPAQACGRALGRREVARSRPWIAPSRGCRSSRARPGP